MTLLRWKAQSLQFHRHLTGPDSKAAQQGILPAFAHIAFVIGSCGGAIAGMAKKAWIGGTYKELDIDRVRSIRRRINSAFDQLESIIEPGEKKRASAILPQNMELAEATYDIHGNFAILALAAMEESAELAVPLMSVADGSKTLEKARPEIEFESADVRINLHIISEKARICAERSTTSKWMLIRERHPEDAFQLPKVEDTDGGKTSNSKGKTDANLSKYLQLL